MIDLRERMEAVIEDGGFVDWACEREGRFRFTVYQGMAAMDSDIDELELSIRSYNCLRHAGYQTINAMVDNIERRDDLLKIRNLARRNADEIMLRLFLYTYQNLKPEKRKAYLKKTKEMN